MKKLTKRRIMRFLADNKKIGILAMCVLAVGIGVFVVKAFAYDLVVKCENLEKTAQGYYNLGTDNQTFTFQSSVSGLSVDTQIVYTQFAWTADRSNLLRVVRDEQTANVDSMQKSGFLAPMVVNAAETTAANSQATTKNATTASLVAATKASMTEKTEAKSTEAKSTEAKSTEAKSTEAKSTEAKTSATTKAATGTTQAAMLETTKAAKGLRSGIMLLAEDESTTAETTTAETTTAATTTVATTAAPTYNSGKFTAQVTGLKAGFSNINVTFTPSNSEAQKTTSQGVFVPLLSTLKAGGSDVTPTSLYEAGTTFVLHSTNVDENNALQFKIYMKNGTEITTSNGLGTDIVFTRNAYNEFVININKSGTYKIVASTNDYLVNSDAKKIDRLKNEYTVNTTFKFLTGAPSGEGNFVELSELLDGATKYKYAVLPDIANAYAVMSNAPENGTPSNYGIRWASNNEKVASVVTPKQGVYNTIQGKYAGIAKITGGLSSTNVSGGDYFISGSTDVCYAIVPHKWSMPGIETSESGYAKSDITMNVNDTYTFTTTGNPSFITWGVSPSDTGSISNGKFTASKQGEYTVTATLADSQFVGESAELVKKMGSPTLKINVHVVDSLALSEESHNLYVDDQFLLKAVATDLNSDVTFTTKNISLIPGEKAPTGNLVSLTPYKDEETGKVVGVYVKGLKAGAVQITGSQTINGVTKSASCMVYVIDKPIEVTSLAIDPPVMEIDRGSVGTLSVVYNKNVSDPDNKRVFWSSSDPNIVTVVGNDNLHTATITAKKGGTAVIMVVSQDGMYSATSTINVREPVKGVTLNYSTVNATIQEKTLQLVATVSPEGDGVNRNVTWTSTDTSVLTVDSAGLVTYKKAGYATVVCTTEDGGYQAYCNFNINVPVESLKLDYTDEILSIGENLRITAEVLPLTASIRTISWESSDTSVCTVDTNGLVTAKGVGFATILCKTIDGSDLTAMCKIYVKQPVTTVKLNVNEIEVKKGTVFWLNATCLPENADNKICSWRTDNKDVCTVGPDGMVTAVGSGTCTITCTNVDTGISDYCIVKVTQPITGITLNSDYQSMWVGAKYAIIPTVLPVDADNKAVTYKSSDPSVASVDKDGVVTALKGGNCIITVTTVEYELKATVTIDVKEYVSSVTLDKSEINLKVGGSEDLKVTVGAETATNKNVTWSSSNSLIAYAQDGKVYGRYPGKAVITVTAADGSGKTATCIVNVVNPVTEITLNPTEMKLKVGDYGKITATITPESASKKDLNWSTSDPKIATVDEYGEVHAIAVGKCKIFATTKDGSDVKAICSVQVTPVTKISSLAINSTRITMLVGKTRKLQVFATPTDNTESTNWYSTDTSIVQVDSEGNITTVGPGIANVVAYGGTTNITSACEVHALALSQTKIDLGQYDTFDLAVDGASGFTISWRTANPRVATVDATGKVTARMRGTTTITATVDDKTLSCTVNVGNLY